MKRFIPLLAILIASLTLHAQKDFEGVITYKMTSPSEGKGRETIELDITFAPSKILIRGRESEDFMEVTLIDLANGMKYILVPKDKTYEVRPLKRFPNLSKPLPQVIEGYSTTPVEMEMSGSGIFSGQAILYFADSLFFHIPPEFRANPELIMVYKNHILLKEVVALRTFGEYDTGNDSTNREVNITAIAVRPGKVDPKDLVVPADYTLEDRSLMTDSTMIATDTIVTSIDTVIAQKPLQQKPPAKKTPAPPKSKTKTPVKGDLKKEQ